MQLKGAVAIVTGLGVFFWSRSVPLALVISGSMLISLVVAPLLTYAGLAVSATLLVWLLWFGH